MSNALELKLALPTGNLAAYRHAVNSVPMLTAAEEKALADIEAFVADLAEHGMLAGSASEESARE